MVEIELPSYIKELNIKDINILYDNELKIKDYKTYVNNNGNNVIRVQLEGEQTQYNYDEITGGANLIINTDMTLEKLTPTKENIVKVYVTNEAVTTYESVEGERGVTTLNIKAVAPVGMVTTNQITGYNNKNESITSISGEQQTGKLDTKSSGKLATVKMDVINNYNNPVENIQILGRIPSEGNKETSEGFDLGSNLTTNLASFKAPEGVNTKLYYSEKPDATKDLNNQANGWTSEMSANTKSYLMVLEDYEMQTGDNLEFGYDVNIPENLSHNRSTYENYTVYFDNIAKEATLQDKAVAPIAGLTTGEGPELEINLCIEDIADGTELQEGTIITYLATVKNVGKSDISNLTAKGIIPEGTTYIYYEGSDTGEEGLNKIFDKETKEYTATLEKLAAGATAKMKYQVSVNSLDFNEETDTIIERTISANTYVTVEGVDTVFTSNTVSNKIIEGFMRADIEVGLQPENVARIEGSEFYYTMSYKNVTSQEKENVVIKDVLPEGIIFVEANCDGSYDERTRTVSWNIEELQGGNNGSVTVTVKADKLGENEYKKEIKNKMSITVGEKTIETRETNVSIEKPNIEISLSSVGNSSVVVGDIIDYQITITNTGCSTTGDITITDQLPKPLTFEGASYVYKGENYNVGTFRDDTAEIAVLALREGESVTVTLQAKVNELTNGLKSKDISNVVKVSSTRVGEKTSNAVKHKITSIGGTTLDPTTGEVVEGKHYISGMVWKDEDKNGCYDEDEDKIQGVEVLLVNGDNGKIVKDIVTGNNKTVKTGENGEFMFANLEDGNYIVVYKYDTSKYNITAYQKDGVTGTRNSDAVSMKMKENGGTINVAATDTIKMSSENISHIDLGLIDTQKFDLKLTKVVSKITVQDKSGVKVSEVADKQLAKFDFNSKTINGANAVIEYKIKITNEGSVAGFAKKIVDYLPKELKFSSELNNNWYQADDGNVYNSSLANEVINPGETKEITLVLTKQMTADSTGNVNNIAEIYEASNDFGLTDIDSTPANKVQSEDDISYADVLLGTKTGEIYVYILITFIAVSMLGVGIYFINRKVLRKI